MFWHRSVISKRKETSCLPLLIAGFEPRKFETPNRPQTVWSLRNRLRYRGSSKIELNSPSLWWVSIQPTWLHGPELVHPWLWRYTYFLFDFDSNLAHGSDFKWRETSCSPLLNAGFEPWKSETHTCNARELLNTKALCIRYNCLVHPYLNFLNWGMGRQSKSYKME